MNIRFTVIAVCSCLCGAASAQTGTQQFRDFTESARLVQKLKPVQEMSCVRPGQAPAKSVRAVKAVAPERMGAARSAAEGPEGKLKLDSIIVNNTDGSKYIRQKFVYGAAGKETNRQVSNWNSSTGTWGEPYEEYNYKWTDYGYIESQQGVSYGAGVRVDYKYNELRLGIEQVNYALGSDGVTWVPQSKGEYKYDDNENIIEEYTYAWDGSKWVSAAHNLATWDAKKRQTSIEAYQWDGKQWVGVNKARYVWFDGPYDPSYVEGEGNPERMTLKQDFFWIDGKWAHYYVFENKIREDGRLIGQAERYFNRSTGKFSGGDDWDGRLSKDMAFTWESTASYDEHGAQLRTDTRRCMPDSSKWVSLGYTQWNWTYAADGSREGYTTSVNYQYDADYSNKTGEAIFYREYYGYDAAGRKTWVLQQLSEDGQSEPESLFEEKYVYDADGRLVCTAVWDWDDNGERKPTNRTDYTLDADGNVVEMITKTGGGGLTPIGSPVMKAPGMTDEDEKGWANSSRWIYTYNGGYITSRMGYRWMQEQWMPNTGQDCVYDWDLPASEVIVPEGWADPYKLDAVTDYYGDGTGGWLTMPREYFWTEFTATGISGVTGGKGGVRVWPTVVDDGFNVEASEGARVSVYSMNGTCVATSASGWVSVSGLPSGIYIVSVDGCKTKIIKK